MTADEILSAALERVREIYPPARSVGFYLEPERTPDHRFHAVVHHDGDLGSGCVIGYGPTYEASLDDLLQTVGGLLEAQRAQTFCLVCAATGTETPGAVTTGDGMMCHEHAIAWLRSEKEASEEHNGELGPCGVKS